MPQINNIFANWMQDLPIQKKEHPINKILLPGTHNSHAYRIDFSRIMGKWKWVRFPIRLIPFARKILSDWTKTQRQDLTAQLHAGIRYFDFRVSYDEKEKRYYLTHTFTCMPLEEALNDIKRFMEAHPGEVLLISAKSDWEHRQVMCQPVREKELLKIVEKSLGSLLCPPRPLNDCSMSIRELTQRNQRILFFYSSETQAASPNIWDGANLKELWRDSFNPKTRIANLHRDIASIIPSNKTLVIAPLTLTPGIRHIIQFVIKKIFLPWKKFETLETSSRRYHAQIHSYFHPSLNKLKNVNIVTTDFPDASFVRNLLRYAKQEK